MADALDGDFSRSRAVLIGTWDYRHLTDVPAARYSLRRFEAMLTGPLGRWPRNRLVKMANRRTVGDLAHELVETFLQATDVALFYYVGHGQYDHEDRLCLALRDSNTDPSLRTTTSLTFDDVRHAFQRSPAKTKIAILDCCFAELAVGSDGRLATAGTPRAPGVYLMMASGQFSAAWFQSAEEDSRPQTYFTKYLVDVIDHGIPGQSAGLTLGPIFLRVAEALEHDLKPEPHREISDDAEHFVLARNAALDPSINRGGTFRRYLRRMWWPVVALAAGVTLLVSVAVIAILLPSTTGSLGASNPVLSHPSAVSGEPVVTTSPTGANGAAAHPNARLLPFTGLSKPGGVAVDAAGDVYIADTGHNRVLRLAANSSTTTELPFTGLLDNPGAVALDSTGNIYVADTGHNRVLRLAAGASTPEVLPFTGSPKAIAVDDAGDVYVSGYYGVTGMKLDFRVMRLAAGSSTPTQLPFTELAGAAGLAVDAAGNVYLAGASAGPNLVLRLAAGSSTPAPVPLTVPSTVPLIGSRNAGGVAVDASGALYITDDLHSPVLRLAPGSSTPTILPPTGEVSLNPFIAITPAAVAVNASGTDAYVIDALSSAVWRLPIGG